MTKRLNYLTRQNGGIEGLVAVETWLASNFDPKLLDLVKVRVSQINGCAYCLHMHRHEAIKRGETEDRLLLLDAWREVQALHGAGTGRARLGRVADAHCRRPRAGRRLRERAERLLGGRAAGTFDRHLGNQRLEPAGDRLSAAASGGPQARRLRQSRPRGPGQSTSRPSSCLGPQNVGASPEPTGPAPTGSADAR